MANDVFANGLEVACKAADGVSAAAFPDVCFTPKDPAPFANTAYAKDITNGSKTVFISGKEVALKDHSYIKCSSGDTGARGRKGISTGAKNGKAYFRSWSMNVKVEGYNVCRHTDSMTHNHGSFPGNTGANPYIDTASPQRCKKDLQRKEKECKVTQKENDDFVDNQKERNKRREKYNKNPKHKEKKSLYNVREKTWKDKHCQGVMFLLDNPKNMLKKLDKLKDEMNDLKSDFSTAAIDAGKGVVTHKVERVAEVGLCGVIGGAVGGVLGFFAGGAGAVPGAILGAEVGASICGAAATAEAVVDTVSAGMDMWNNKDKIAAQISKLQKGLEKVDHMQKMLNETDPDKKKALKEQMQKETQDIIKKDKCLKAKRCILVAYASQNNAKKIEDKGRSNPVDKAFQLGNLNGCCPGQTGHHLIYDAMVKHCAGYKHSKAPTVCVEGSNQNNSTHRDVHDLTDVNTQDMINSEYSQPAGHDKCASDFTMECAIESGADAHAKRFPNAKCKKSCIKQQLRDYYKKLKCKPKPLDKNGNVIEPSVTPSPTVISD